MRKLIGLMIVGALLSFGQMANAGAIQDNIAAHEAASIRDRATAMKLARPWAELATADRGSLNPADDPLIGPRSLFRQTEPALESRWAITSKSRHIMYPPSAEGADGVR